METLEIQGTPTESGAQEGGDEEGLEEAVAETIATENVPLENLDEFSVPTYSPQELLNRKDFSEMGVEESRAIARAILLIADQDRDADQPAQEARAQGQRRGSALDHAQEHEIRRRDHRPGQSQTTDQENPGGAALRRERFDGLLQPLLDSVHVRAAKRAMGSGDLRLQHFAQPHHPSDPYQGYRQCPGKNFRQYTRLVRRHQHRALAAYVQPQLRAQHGHSSNGGRYYQRWLGPRRREFARAGDAGLEAQMQEDHLAQSIAGERQLRASCVRVCKAALPYLDLFLSVHNVNSLIALGRTLQKMVA